MSSASDLRPRAGQSAGSALRRLRVHARGHGGLFLRAVPATVAACGLLLALPWAVDGLVAALLDPGGARSRVLLASVGLVALVSGIGLADHLQRLWFARFAIAWTRSLRAAAMGAVLAHPAAARRGRSGDLVSRLIADSARFKAGVKVFLIYVAPNVLLVGGATVVLGLADPRLGFVFAGVLVAVLAASSVGARATRAAWGRFRESEGRFAGALEQGGGPALEEADEESVEAEVEETTTTSRTACAAHAIVGASVLATLALGVRGVGAGDLEPRALVVFVSYVFLLTKPMVRLARHGARTGKIVASGARLLELVDDRPDGGEPSDDDPLVLADLPVVGGGARDLVLRPGEPLVVEGPAGGGKSRLLAALAGGEPTWPGRVLVGARDVRRVAAWGAPGRVGRLEEDPRWSRQPFWQAMGLPVPGALEPTLEPLVAPLLATLPAGWETAVASKELSTGERRCARLAGLLSNPPPVVLLDEPLRGLDDAEAALVREALLRVARARILVVANGVPGELGTSARRVVCRDGHPALGEDAP